MNGGVSLAGNAGLMWLLAGRLGLDPLLANLLAVGACSLLNFFGSDRLVFKPLAPGMSPPSRRPASGLGRSAAATLTAVVLALLPVRASSEGGPAKPATLAAWEAYERQVDARYGREVSQPFFAADALGGASTLAERSGGRSEFRCFRPDARRPGAAEPEVPDGRIHHWVGATFVKGMTVAAVIASLQAHAGQESHAYEDVIASRLLSRDGDRVNVFLKLRRTKVITATYNTEHRVEYRRLGATRGLESKRVHPDRRARRCRHPGRAGENRGRGQRLPVAAQCLLALRADRGRRLDRMRVGQLEPRSPGPAPPVHLRASSKGSRESHWSGR